MQQLPPTRWSRLPPKHQSPIFPKLRSPVAARKAQFNKSGGSAHANHNCSGVNEYFASLLTRKRRYVVTISNYRILWQSARFIITAVACTCIDYILNSAHLRVSLYFELMPTCLIQGWSRLPHRRITLLRDGQQRHKRRVVCLYKLDLSQLDGRLGGGPPMT